MPKVSEIYAGTYMKGSELNPLGKHYRARVNGVRSEVMGQGQDRKEKLVLSLAGANGKPWGKEVVLNKTNSIQLATGFGDDTDGWIGRTIELWSEQVLFQGRMQPGIKILPALGVAAPLRQPVKPPAPPPASRPAPPVSETEPDGAPPGADWDETPPGDDPNEIPF